MDKIFSIFRRADNLMPWIEYFDMLRSYQRCGFLEIMEGKNEAYITLAALQTLIQPRDGEATDIQAIPGVAMRIKAYAGWREQKEPAYLRKPFAVHVVRDDARHDPILTILLTRRRKWLGLGSECDVVNVIRYDNYER